MNDLSSRLDAALKRHRGGDLAGAMVAYRAILAEAPEEADALHLLGVATLQGGDPSAAAELIERAIRAAPTVAKYHVNLGEARRALGAADAAVACYRRAIGLDPANAAARNNLGAVLLRQGHVAEARQALEEAARVAPNDAQAQANLGQARWRGGDLLPALESLANATLLAPQNLSYRQLLVHVARSMPSTDLPPMVWKQLLDCFSVQGVDTQPLTRPVLAVARRTPEFQAIQQLSGATPEAARAALAEGAGSELLGSRLLSDLLFQTVITDPVTEAALVPLRRAMLDEASDDSRSPEAGVLGTQPVFAAGLAVQAHASGYLYPVTPHELDLVDRLTGRLAQDAVLGRLTGGDKAALQRLLVAAAYRPLSGPGADGLSGVAGVIEMASDRFAPRLRLLAKRQIGEAKQEAALAASLQPLAPGAVVDDSPGVSGARWQTLNKLPPVALAERTASLFPSLEFRLRAGRVLVAGCAMGKTAIELASQLGDARVTGIDRRRADLAYARRMAREHGVASLDFRLGGPSDLDPTEAGYDLIEATVGLDDLPGLAAALVPGGLLMLILPTERRAKEQRAARDHVAGAGLAPRDLPEARRRLLALPADHPARAVLAWDAFYARPSAATLLFGSPPTGIAVDASRAAVAAAGLQWLGLQREDVIVTEPSAEDLMLRVWARKLP